MDSHEHIWVPAGLSEYCEICHVYSSPELDNLERIKRRYNDMLADPEGTRHLLHLLSLGKGNRADFENMLDRIHMSRKAANART